MHFSFQHEVISCLEVTASLKCSHSSPENEDLKRNLVWDCELEYFEINKHWILKIREYSLINLRDFNILKSYAAKSLQLCLTLCDPIDGSPTGSSVPAILQTRTLEWVAISFCNAGKWKWSCSVVSDISWPHGLQPTWLLCLWNFSGLYTYIFSPNTYWSWNICPSSSLEKEGETLSSIPEWKQIISWEKRRVVSIPEYEHLAPGEMESFIPLNETKALP